MLRWKYLSFLFASLFATAVVAAPLVADSDKTSKGHKHEEHAQSEHHEHVPMCPAHWSHGFHHGGSPLHKLIEGEIGHWLVFKSEFDLSWEQKAKLLKIVIERKNDFLHAVHKVWSKRNALRDAVLAGKSESDIREAADAMGKSIGDTAVLVSKVVKDVKPVLTEKQRALIAKLRTDSDAAVDKFFNEVQGKGHERKAAEHKDEHKKGEKKKD